MVNEARPACLHECLNATPKKRRRRDELDAQSTQRTMSREQFMNVKSRISNSSRFSPKFPGNQRRPGVAGSDAPRVHETCNRHLGCTTRQRPSSQLLQGRQIHWGLEVLHVFQPRVRIRVESELNTRRQGQNGCLKITTLRKIPARDRAESLPKPGANTFCPGASRAWVRRFAHDRPLISP
jgi:hypothetical protein